MDDVFDDNPFAVANAGGRPWTRVIRGLLLLVVCATAAFGLHTAGRIWLFDRLTSNLEQHEGRIQRERLAMIAEFGDRGIQFLASTVASPNENLSESAAQELGRTRSRFHTDPGELNRIDAFILPILRQQSEWATPEQAQRIAGLMRQIAMDHASDSDGASPELFALASQSLSQLPGPVHNAQNPTGLNSNLPQPQNLVLSTDQSDPSSLGVPRRMRPLPLRISREEIGAFPFSDHEAPAEFDDAAEASSAGRDTAPPPITPAAPTPPSTLDPGVQPADPPVLLRPPADVITTSAIETARNALTDNPFATFETREVVSLVSSVRPNFRAAAMEELRNRGFNQSDLDLAVRISSTSANTRLQMIEELKQRPDVDAVQWLIWLATDIERDVRLEAISVLSPMRDPRIDNALRQLERQERDRVVLGRLRRVLETR